MARKTLLVCDRCDQKKEVVGAVSSENWSCQVKLPLVGIGNSGYPKSLDLCQECQIDIAARFGIEPKVRKKRGEAHGVDRTATPVG